MNIFADVNPFLWRSAYVKPVDDSDITPVIPSEIEGVKVCRWRETKGKWSHLPQVSRGGAGTRVASATIAAFR